MTIRKAIGQALTFITPPGKIEEEGGSNTSATALARELLGNSYQYNFGDPEEENKSREYDYDDGSGVVTLPNRLIDPVRVENEIRVSLKLPRRESFDGIPLPNSALQPPKLKPGSVKKPGP